MVVHGKGDAATHVTDNKVLLLVFHAVFAAVSLGNLALVQGVPDGLMGQLRQAGNTCHVVELIYYAWVNGEGTAALNLAGYTQRYQRTQVAGVMQSWVPRVLNHLLVQLIYAALYRLHQASATHDNVEVHLVALSLKLLQNLSLAVVEFVHDERIAAQFFERVVKRGVHQQLLVLEDSHFSRNHSRVNGKYFHSHLLISALNIHE